MPNLARNNDLRLDKPQVMHSVQDGTTQISVFHELTHHQDVMMPNPTWIPSFQTDNTP